LIVREAAMSGNAMLRNAMIVATLLGASAASTAATPPAPHADTKASLQAQVKDSEAKIAAARAQNATLQAQVSQMEQQNATRGKQMQARDAEIAALQQKLQAAGAPASAGSAGHRP
jgi:septal ring factor EnvC (AmiA/AmiB activator)